MVVRYWKLKIEDKWYRWNEAKARLELQTFFPIGGRRKRRRGRHENGVKKDKKAHNKNYECKEGKRTISIMF